MSKKVYTAKEVANELGIGLNKTYDLLHQNVIPNKQIGRKFIIPKAALDQWLLNIGR